MIIYAWMAETSVAKLFFAGFLPSRTGARQSRLRELASIPATLIFYEAPHRLAGTLNDAHSILGEREAVVARELTKLHEELRRGKLSELAEHYSREEVRGEVVLVIDRTTIDDGVSVSKENLSIAAIVERYEAEGLDHRAALKKAARDLGLSRAAAYRQLLAERASS